MQTNGHKCCVCNSPITGDIITCVFPLYLYIGWEFPAWVDNGYRRGIAYVCSECQLSNCTITDVKYVVELLNDNMIYHRLRWDKQGNCIISDDGEAHLRKSDEVTDQATGFSPAPFYHELARLLAKYGMEGMAGIWFHGDSDIFGGINAIDPNADKKTKEVVSALTQYLNRLTDELAPKGSHQGTITTVGIEVK